MTSKLKLISIASLALVATLLFSACGAVLPSSAPGYEPGGMMGSGGMMGGGYGYQNATPARGYGYGPGGMMGGGMMGGYGYGQSAPTAQPTAIGATPIPVDEEIQITAANGRFAPTLITVKPGETVRFVVANTDPFLHNFVSQEAGIPFLNLPGNTTQTVTWTAPAQTGAYTAVCTLHPGMVLTVVVEDN